MDTMLFWLRLHTVFTFEGIEKLIKGFDFMSHDFEMFSMLYEKVINFAHNQMANEKINLDDILILMNCIPKGNEEKNFPKFKTSLETELGEIVNHSYIVELLHLDDYNSGINRVQFIAQRTGGYETYSWYVINALEALMRISDKDYKEVASDIENANCCVIDNGRFWKELKDRVLMPWPQLHYLHLVY
jgi:hypothetical protein